MTLILILSLHGVKGSFSLQSKIFVSWCLVFLAPASAVTLTETTLCISESQDIELWLI